MASAFSPSASTHRRNTGARRVWLVIVALVASMLPVGLGAVSANAAGSGSISGTVLDSHGAAVAGGYVTAYRQVSVAGGTSINYAGSAVLDASGNFAVQSLDAGSYTLDFSGPFGANYAEQWWDNKPDQYSATFFALGAGESLTGKNAVLSAGATISGTVTDSANNPVSGASVQALTNGSYSGYFHAFTDSSGNYSIVGLPAASFTLDFSSPTGGNYIQQYWKNKPLQSLADYFPVAAQEAVTGKDATLLAGATISGTVTDSSIAPVSGASVYAQVLGGSTGLYAATTDSHGHYSIAGLGPGTYTLDFRPQFGANLVEQWWSNKPTQATADYISVANGDALTGKDAVLSIGATIGGTVTDSGLNPISGASITAYRSTGNFLGSTSSDESGHYSFVGLDAGSYTLHFSTYGQNFVAQWWNNKPSLAQADYFSVPAHASIADKNAALVVGATISGTITDPTNIPVSGASVAVYLADGTLVSSGQSDSTGHYMVAAVAAGSYTLKVSTYGQNYLDQWWNSKTTQALADYFPVSSGDTISGKDFSLVEGGKITGNVSWSPTTPLAFAQVMVKGSAITTYASTDAMGNYTAVGLPTGSYSVWFESPYGQNYASEWWSGKASSTTADPVPVTAGQTTPDTNAVLASGATISGNIKGPGNLDLPNAYAYARNLDPTARPYDVYAPTDAYGNYTLRGLPAGRYTLGFGSTGLAPQWLGNTNSQASAPSFDVAPAATVTGKDIVLSAASSLSGTVRDAAGNAFAPSTGSGTVLLPKVSVYDAAAGAQSANSLVGQGQADLTTGAFTIPGLGAGTYKVQFTMAATGYGLAADPSGAYAPEWSNHAASFASGATLTVASPGQSVTGVDGVLYKAIIGVGSRQSQDVLAGAGTEIPRVVSYPSDGSATITTRPGGTAFSRPADSIAGQKSISAAVLGATYEGATVTGSIDFARSSIGPSTGIPGTDLTFVPFAKDAVTFAVNAASDFPRDIALGAPSQDTIVPAPFTLRNIYRGAISTYADSNFNTVVVRPLLPRAGSETRSFWLEGLGLSESTLGSAVTDAGGFVSEDGSTQVTGSGDILPISVAAYIAEGNHNSLPTTVVERRGQTELGFVGSVKPYVAGSGGNVVNPVFPLTRLIFNVVPTSRLSGTSADDVSLQGALAGPTSEVCGNTGMIEKYGYATIGSMCGNTALYKQGLRLAP